MRRLTGLLTSLLLLHLTIVGADLACAKHDVHTASHALPSATSPDHEHHAVPAQAHDRDDKPCQVPTLPACCYALASCGVSLTCAASQGAADIRSLAARAVASADYPPYSWASEPDPPPPKA